MKKLNNKGFSLVELIIVIAIMAILIAVLAPQFLRYVERSRYQKDVSAVGELQNAMKVAASDERIAGATGVAWPLTATITNATGVYDLNAGDATADAALVTEITATIPLAGTPLAQTLQFTSSTITAAAGNTVISVSQNGAVTLTGLPAAP